MKITYKAVGSCESLTVGSVVEFKRFGDEVTLTLEAECDTLIKLDYTNKILQECRKLNEEEIMEMQDEQLDYC